MEAFRKNICFNTTVFNSNIKSKKPILAAIETLDRCDKTLMVVTTREFHASEWEPPVFIYFRYVFANIWKTNREFC